MINELTQTIKDEISKLPKEKQTAVESLDWLDISREIGQEHLLTEEETIILQKEVLVALLGLTNADTLINNIEDNVGTTKEEAINIANDLSKKIFEPVATEIEENIKKQIKKSDTDFKQTLDFILSNGDYSSFVTQNSPPPEYSNGGVNKLSIPIKVVPQAENKKETKIEIRPEELKQ